MGLKRNERLEQARGIFLDATEVELEMVPVPVQRQHPQLESSASNVTQERLDFLRTLVEYLQECQSLSWAVARLFTETSFYRFLTSSPQNPEEWLEAIGEFSLLRAVGPRVVMNEINNHLPVR